MVAVAVVEVVVVAAGVSAKVEAGMDNTEPGKNN